MLKQRKADVLAAIKAEMLVPAGREVKRTAYTAWGQWQIVVGDVVAPKATATKRLTLAQWQEQQSVL